jgi:hypothetical protein
MSEKSTKLNQEIENRIKDFNRRLKKSNYNPVEVEKSAKEQTISQVASRMDEVSKDATAISEEDGPTLQDPEFVECIDIITAGSNIVDEHEENIENYEEKIIELTLSQLS